MLLKPYQSFDAFQQDWTIFAKKPATKPTNQQPSQQKNNLLLWSCPNYEDIKCQCNMLWKTFTSKTSTLLGKDKPVSSSISTLTFLSSHTAKNLQHPNFFVKIKHVGYLIGNVKILIMWQTPKQDYVQFTYSKNGSPFSFELWETQCCLFALQWFWTVSSPSERGEWCMLLCTQSPPNTVLTKLVLALFLARKFDHPKSNLFLQEVLNCMRNLPGTNAL